MLSTNAVRIFSLLCASISENWKKLSECPNYRGLNLNNFARKLTHENIGVNYVDFNSHTAILVCDTEREAFELKKMLVEVFNSAQLYATAASVYYNTKISPTMVSFNSDNIM